MANKENEYKKIFIGEANDNIEEVDQLLTQLEKKPTDQAIIDNVFRIMHTLKGNASGMGFEKISKFTHVLEDLFAEIKKGSVELDKKLFESIFKASDILTALIEGLTKENSSVRYRGIQRKLEVIVEKARSQDEAKEKEEKKSEKPKAATKQKALNKSSTKKEKSKEEQTAISKGKIETESSKIAEDDKDTETLEALAEKLEESKAFSKNIQGAEKDFEAKNDGKKITFSDMVQVPVHKLDNLLNLVGELIIERDRIITTHEKTLSRNEFNRLKRISSDLQYSVMDVRLIQVGFLFNKFHRVVRDAATEEGKSVDLHIEGSETEIDRNILQIISDSLIHLIRNAVGHGIESSVERKRLKKPEVGKLTLSAYNESEGVIIEIKDDGAGINAEAVKRKIVERNLVDASQIGNLSREEIISFIFNAGFSTNDSVTSISGRGVGMDVVKKAIESVGGNIRIVSNEGEGTTFKLILPSSMAVKSTLLFEIGSSQYAVPLTYTDAVLSLEKNEIFKIQNRLMLSHQGKTIEIVSLKSLFFPDQFKEENLLEQEGKWNIIVVNHNGRHLGLIVDRLLQQKEIVEKPLKKPVDFVNHVSGVTILGNGKVCLVINIPQIIQKLFSNSTRISKNSVA